MSSADKPTFDRTWTFVSAVDGLPITAYGWNTPSPKAVVVISHGAAEHALRYVRFARALNAAGFAVLAPDQRGHGASAGPRGLGDFGAGGWDGLVADIGQLIADTRKEHRSLPIVLFGHSMGAAACRHFAPLGSDTIDALILSGTGVRTPPKEGDPRPNWNASFEPGRTGYEWLSRDDAEVDKYVADPLCGFDKQTVKMGATLINHAVLADPAQHRKIRPDLPVLFVAGDADPINRKLEGLNTLERWWRDAGVRQIDKLYYRDGRHEMLNETNRDEVTRDIAAWIHTTVGA
jgi:alpha-beta hydrolase superfamily lysophospholipase